jgi:hypothetical protein
MLVSVGIALFVGGIEESVRSSPPDNFLKICENRRICGLNFGI